MTLIHIPTMEIIPHIIILNIIIFTELQNRRDSKINHMKKIRIYNCNEYELILCVVNANVTIDEQYNNLHAFTSNTDNKLQLRMNRA